MNKNAQACSDRCAGNVVTIAFQVRGEQVTMKSCSYCDRRSWSRNGSSIDLPTLLGDIAATQTLRKAS